jgi:hypothetical protein
MAENMRAWIFFRRASSLVLIVFLRNALPGAMVSYQLENEEPRIIFSSTPAVLALIDGEPALRPAGHNLQMVINTRAIIVFNQATQTYYLALMDSWVQATAENESWFPARNAPFKSLHRLRRAAELARRNHVLGNPKQSLKQAYEERKSPTVYVSSVPTELILSEGPPQFTPIIGTSLLYVENSGNDIFLDSSTQVFYILVSGRWFKSNSLQKGSWAYVTAADLPSDFARIPTFSPKASVLASVPGTLQAREALIANQIPHIAAISRSAAKLHLKYDGTPDFQVLEGTHLCYAVNTTTPVIYIPGSHMYYAVRNAVWFTSGNADGPWTPATFLPPAIYTIPPSSPIHYVTYVRVYGYTPTTVYMGYTSGYFGTMVSWDNVVVYGTGWSYPPYVGASEWVPHPSTYGAGAMLSWTAAAGWALRFRIR